MRTNRATNETMVHTNSTLNVRYTAIQNPNTPPYSAHKRRIVVRYTGSYVRPVPYLCDHGVKHLSLERPEHDGFVLDRVDDETAARLDQAGPDIVDGRHRNDEAILAGTGPLHLKTG